MVYKDKGNNLQTTLCHKPTDQQSYLHAKLEHPGALKNSITYSKTLRVKIICSTVDEYQRNCAVMRHKFLKRKCDERNLNNRMEKIDLIERKEKT